MWRIKRSIFTFATESRTTCGIKKHRYFVKLIMPMVSCSTFAKSVKKSWIFDRRGGWQFDHVFDKVILASTANERTTLVTIVSYIHNVAAKHGSSKPLTTSKLWLLALRIKSTRLLPSIPDALWDMCKSSVVFVLLMHPSKETLNSPSSRVDADSTSRRRRILKCIFSGVGESWPN